MSLHFVQDLCWKRHNPSGPVAQRLEQGTHNPLVVGSNPTGPTRLRLQLVAATKPVPAYLAAAGVPARAGVEKRIGRIGLIGLISAGSCGRIRQLLE